MQEQPGTRAAGRRTAAGRTQHGVPYRGIVDSTRLVGLAGNLLLGDGGGVALPDSTPGAIPGDFPASADGSRVPTSCAAAHAGGSSTPNPRAQL